MDSTSRILDPRIVGDEHYRVAREVQKVLQTYKSLQDIIAILGMDELSEEDKLIVARCKGEYDHLPEAAFYMVGTIEEAIQKAEDLAKEAAA